MDIKQQLFDLCSSVQTGTFFIATEDNKACHIILEEGRIIGLSYGRIKGDAAIAEILAIKAKTASFKDVMMPLPSKTKVTSSDAVLKRLGFDPNAPSGAETAERQQKRYRGTDMDVEVDERVDKYDTKKKVLYRGQELTSKSEPESESESKPVSEKEAAPKKVRMYRGQQIKD